MRLESTRKHPQGPTSTEKNIYDRSTLNLSWRWQWQLVWQEEEKEDREFFKSPSISSAHRNHKGEEGRGRFWEESRNERRRAGACVCGAEWLMMQGIPVLLQGLFIQLQSLGGIDRWVVKMQTLWSTEIVTLATFKVLILNPCTRVWWGFQKTTNRIGLTAW